MPQDRALQSMLQCSSPECCHHLLPASAARLCLSEAMHNTAYRDSLESSHGHIRLMVTPHRPPIILRCRLQLIIMYLRVCKITSMPQRLCYSSALPPAGDPADAGSLAGVPAG